MRKGFVIAGLVFIFAALIFAASTHLFYAHKAKQTAVEFAFIADATTSLETDFPSMLVTNESSVAQASLYKMRCRASDADLRADIENGVSQLNLLLAGTGIEIEIRGANYTVRGASCPPRMCGLTANVRMDYMIKTPFFHKTRRISADSRPACSYS